MTFKPINEQGLKCPACGKPVYYGYKDENIRAVGHELPECEKFLTMGGDDFLFWTLNANHKQKGQA